MKNVIEILKKGGLPRRQIKSDAQTFAKTSLDKHQKNLLRAIKQDCILINVFFKFFWSFFIA